MRKNTKQLVINSNWTADVPIKGWRHYRISRRFYEEKDLWIELMSVCDRSVIVTVSAREFSRDENWLPGWK